jgi:hypothetical protein
MIGACGSIGPILCGEELHTFFLWDVLESRGLALLLETKSRQIGLDSF